MQKLVPANGLDVEAPAVNPTAGLFDMVVSEAHVLAEGLTQRAAPSPAPEDRFDNTPSFAPSTGMRPGGR